MIYFTIISVILLITMGLFHFYWVIGGKIGLEKVIPTKEDGEKFFNPSNLATTIVGVILLGFAYLAYCLGFEILEENSICIYLGNAVSILFLLRVLGDFKMVGVFKKIKTTPFAKYDTLLFIPLCMYLGIYIGTVSLLF